MPTEFDKLLSHTELWDENLSSRGQDLIHVLHQSTSFGNDDKARLNGNEVQALSLCRKAGALTMGFDAVEDACVKSKAWLVMVASDASAKTVQRLNYSVGDLVDVITMPLTQDKLADISRKPVAVYAVTDRNLAKLCFDRLSDCGAIKNEEDMSE